MVEIPPDLLVVSDDDLAVVYPLVVPASYGQLDGFPASLIPLSEERLALTWVALTRPEWMVYVKPAIVTAWEARGVDLYDRAMANMREADADRTWTHEKADAWGRLIWSFHVMRARLRAAAPAAAAVAVGVLLGVLVIDPNTPPPGGWAASDYLAAAIGGTLLFACVLSVVAVWPRRGLHVLWWATVALWLRLILPSMPTDVRSGMAVLRVFVFWTALALPLFATAVWRARPHTARGWRRAAVGAALWMAALAFALPYRDIASDIWLPRQPYARLGAIAWVSVAPLPVLLGLVVTKMTGRAQARPAVQRVADLER